jgi:hypothetical protein
VGEANAPVYDFSKKNFSDSIPTRAHCRLWTMVYDRRAFGCVAELSGEFVLTASDYQDYAHQPTLDCDLPLLTATKIVDPCATFYQLVRGQARLLGGPFGP